MESVLKDYIKRLEEAYFKSNRVLGKEIYRCDTINYHRASYYAGFARAILTIKRDLEALGSDMDKFNIESFVNDALNDTQQDS